MITIRLPLGDRQVVSADQPSIEEQGWKAGAADRGGDDAEILNLHFEPPASRPWVRIWRTP